MKIPCFSWRSFQCHRGEPVRACILNKTAPEIPPRVRDTATAPSSERWSQWQLHKSNCICLFPFSALFHLLQAVKTWSNPIFKQPCTAERELPWNYWASSGVPNMTCPRQPGNPNPSTPPRVQFEDSELSSPISVPLPNVQEQDKVWRRFALISIFYNKGTETQ